MRVSLTNQNFSPFNEGLRLHGSADSARRSDQDHAGQTGGGQAQRWTGYVDGMQRSKICYFSAQRSDFPRSYRSTD